MALKFCPCISKIINAEVGKRENYSGHSLNPLTYRNVAMDRYLATLTRHGWSWVESSRRGGGEATSADGRKLMICLSEKFTDFHQCVESCFRVVCQESKRGIFEVLLETVCTCGANQ